MCGNLTHMTDTLAFKKTFQPSLFNTGSNFYLFHGILKFCQITFEAFVPFQLSTIWQFIIGGHVSLDLASSHICSIAFHLSQYYSHSLGSLQFPGFLCNTICGSYFRLLRAQHVMPMTGVTGDDSHLVKSQHPHIHHVTNLQNLENI